MSIRKFIELMLIDEYADKDLFRGYTLDLETLSEHDKTQLIDQLLEHDSTFQEMVDEYLQKVINEVLVEKELRDRESSGLVIKYHADGDSYFCVERR